MPEVTPSASLKIELQLTVKADSWFLGMGKLSRSSQRIQEGKFNFENVLKYLGNIQIVVLGLRLRRIL